MKTEHWSDVALVSVVGYTWISLNMLQLREASKVVFSFAVHMRFTQHAQMNMASQLR